MLFDLAVVLVFVIALLLVLSRLAKAPTRQGLQRLALPLGALGLALAIGSTAYFLLANLPASPDTPPAVSSLGELHPMEDGSRVALAGRVSPMMPPVYEAHVACVGPTGCRTPELIIELRDGIIPLSNADYAAINWPGGEVQHLDRGDPVIVTGTLEHWVTPLGECPYAGRREAEFLYVRAEEVFFGTLNDYAAHLRRDRLWPVVTAVAGWGVGAEMLAAALVIRLARRLRANNEPS